MELTVADLLKAGTGPEVPRDLEALYNIDVCNAFISKTIQARYTHHQQWTKKPDGGFPKQL